MKFLLALTLTISYSLSWANSPWNEITIELDNRIEYLQQNPRQQNFSKTIEVSSLQNSNNDQIILSQMMAGYNFLKKFSLPYRYQYIYDGTNALLKGKDSLSKWIHSANKELQSRNFHPKFYIEWNEHVKDMKSALNQETSKVGTKSSTVINEMITIDHSHEVHFLSNLSKKIVELQNKQITQTEKNIDTTSVLTSFLNAKKEEFIFGTIGFLALFGCFYSLRTSSKTKKKKTLKTKQQKHVTTAATKIVKDAIEEFEKSSQPAVVQKSNLENSYRECLEKNDHLLRQAELNIVNSLTSPFDTEVHVEKERLDQALNFLMRGTLAVVNTAQSKASHLEWNCSKNNNRLSLNLTLHGIHCDEKSLYLNTLIDGDYSGPAFFGRTEQTLEEHSPAVIFKNADKKTIISLTMDTTQVSIGH